MKELLGDFIASPFIILFLLSPHSVSCGFYRKRSNGRCAGINKIGEFYDLFFIICIWVKDLGRGRYFHCRYFTFLKTFEFLSFSSSPHEERIVGILFPNSSVRTTCVLRAEGSLLQHHHMKTSPSSFVTSRWEVRGENSALSPSFHEFNK